ncbi:MAG: hypothetical protein WCR19_04360 [Acholeplasmataceae bacterium]
MKAIIYYSLSGHTDQKVHELFEGEFFRLKGKIKIPKKYWLQIMYLGMFSTFDAKLKYEHIDIDFDQYDEIVLASPVWAFTIVPFMKKFLRDHKFKNKNVTLLITHQGGPKKALEHFKRYLDSSNKIIDSLEFNFGNQYKAQNKQK